MIKIIVLLGILSSIFGCNTPGSNGNAIANDTITYFSFSQGGGMRPFDGFKYCVETTKDGRVHFLFNEGYPDEKEFTIDDHSVFDSLQQIVLKHKMYTYSGNYQPEERIFDGHSWNLFVKYASRATISAGGYMAGPDGYGKAFDDIISCLDRWKETPVEANPLVSFDYVYGTTHYRIEPQDDHTLVTIDNASTGLHEVIEKPLDMIEDLRMTTIIEGLRESWDSKSDDPNSTPFEFDILFSNGDQYVYKSYDLNYRCHKTEVMFWFMEKWGIENNIGK